VATIQYNQGCGGFQTNRALWGRLILQFQIDRFGPSQEVEAVGGFERGVEGEHVGRPILL